MGTGYHVHASSVGYRVSAVLVAAALAVGALAGCGGGGAKRATTIKMCTALPVSGADTSAGKPAENGVAHLRPCAA
jgi:hypothetical protein